MSSGRRGWVGPEIVRTLLLVVSAVAALGAAFVLLLWASGLEAEHLNVGTLLGREDEGPRVGLLPLGVALGAAAALLALAGFAFSRRR